MYEDTNISKMLGEKALVGGVGKGSASRYASVAERELLLLLLSPLHSFDIFNSTS